MDQLAEAIRQAVRGEATLHPRVATRLIQELHGPKQGNINPFTELTDREMDVLKLIADGLPNSQIAERLDTAAIERDLTGWIKLNILPCKNITLESHITGVISDQTTAHCYNFRNDDDIETGVCAKGQVTTANLNVFCNG